MSRRRKRKSMGHYDSDEPEDTNNNGPPITKSKINITGRAQEHQVRPQSKSTNDNNQCDDQNIDIDIKSNEKDPQTETEIEKEEKIEEKIQLGWLTKPGLVAICKQYGLSTAGTVKQLRERLLKHKFPIVKKAKITKNNNDNDSDDNDSDDNDSDNNTNCKKLINEKINDNNNNTKDQIIGKINSFKELYPPSTFTLYSQFKTNISSQTDSSNLHKLLPERIQTTKKLLQLLIDNQVKTTGHCCTIMQCQFEEFKKIMKTSDMNFMFKNMIIGGDQLMKEFCNKKLTRHKIDNSVYQSICNLCERLYQNYNQISELEQNTQIQQIKPKKNRKVNQEKTKTDDINSVDVKTENCLTNIDNNNKTKCQVQGYKYNSTKNNSNDNNKNNATKSNSNDDDKNKEKVETQNNNSNIEEKTEISPKQSKLDKALEAFLTLFSDACDTAIAYSSKNRNDVSQELNCKVSTLEKFLEKENKIDIVKNLNLLDKYPAFNALEDANKNPLYIDYSTLSNCFYGLVDEILTEDNNNNNNKNSYASVHRQKKIQNSSQIFLKVAAQLVEYIKILVSKPNQIQDSKLNESKLQYLQRKISHITIQWFALFRELIISKIISATDMKRNLSCNTITLSYFFYCKTVEITNKLKNVKIDHYIINKDDHGHQCLDVVDNSDIINYASKLITTLSEHNTSKADNMCQKLVEHKQRYTFCIEECIQLIEKIPNHDESILLPFIDGTCITNLDKYCIPCDLIYQRTGKFNIHNTREHGIVTNTTSEDRIPCGNHCNQTFGSVDSRKRHLDAVKANKLAAIIDASKSPLIKGQEIRQDQQAQQIVNVHSSENGIHGMLSESKIADVIKVSRNKDANDEENKNT